MNIILIDTGTTNSRIRLVGEINNEVLDIDKIQIGVRNTAIEGSNKTLKSKLISSMDQMLTRNKLEPSDIKYIVASGMITSNLGIYEVPHITAPVNAKDFADHSKIVKWKDFYNITSVFIPGMKNSTNILENEAINQINQFDVMRGEEVETYGLLKQVDVEGSGIVILPGSHTKFVKVEKDLSISSCFSTLGGEMLFATQKETILSNSLEENLIQKINKVILVEGFEAAKKYGLTRSFYHIRLLQMFTDMNINDRANYFVGSVIYEDLRTLFQTEEEMKNLKWVIVGGSDPLRGAFSHLIRHINENWKVIEMNHEQVENALVIGAQEILSHIKNR